MTRSAVGGRAVCGVDMCRASAGPAGCCEAVPGARALGLECCGTPGSIRTLFTTASSRTHRPPPAARAAHEARPATRHHRQLAPIPATSAREAGFALGVLDTVVARASAQHVRAPAANRTCAQSSRWRAGQRASARRRTSHMKLIRRPTNPLPSGRCSRAARARVSSPRNPRALAEPPSDSVDARGHDASPIRPWEPLVCSACMAREDPRHAGGARIRREQKKTRPAVALVSQP